MNKAKQTKLIYFTVSVVILTTNFEFFHYSYPKWWKLLQKTIPPPPKSHNSKNKISKIWLQVEMTIVLQVVTIF